MLNYYKILKAFNVNDSDAIFYTYQLETEFGCRDIKNESIIYFLANVLHESVNLTKFKESLYYTTEKRLREVFPSYFVKLNYKASDYLKSSEKLANLVYNDRIVNKGLGNNKDGDGYKYLGRGAIQITGKNNYNKVSSFLNDNEILQKTNLLETKEYALKSAIAFWFYSGAYNKTNLSDARKVVVGKSNFGYNDVLNNYNKIKKVISND